MSVTSSNSSLAKTRHGKRGRPRKPDALTPAQRAQRYRDKQRLGIATVSATLIAFLMEDAAKTFDRAAHEDWQRSLAEETDRIDREFHEAMAAWDT
ncbi:hypothetical protein ACHAC9_16900 [Massilia sp. CMS3.1]|uniref:hypothetical protein n=1 Tax=Massilia sp. CMS3.1 TaxID=3373083 RepID=UPI003EE43D0D